MLTIILIDAAHTEKLGHALGTYIQDFFTQKKSLPINAILLRGDLGSGKTALTAALVRALCGGDTAEISSPSFTLCNSYSTQPEVLHCDLYRCAHNMPDDIWEALEQPHILTIIEWAEYVPREALPSNFLDISLKICVEGRLAKIEGEGATAYELLQVLQEMSFSLLKVQNNQI